MRVYENLINNLVMFDLPRTKNGQSSVRVSRSMGSKVNRGPSHKTYIHKIFERLLVYDQLPDNDFEGVLREAGLTALMSDPAFEILFNNVFEQYVQNSQHHAKWQKIRQDYNSYIEWETKRRNKDNPYFNSAPDKIPSWDSLPDFSKQKHNQPYQFDHIYRDSQSWAGEIYELTKNYKEQGDKDLFRAKVNSILVPSKIVFALNNNQNITDFSDTEMTLVNMKISLDAYKLAHVFLNRAIESLHKMRWDTKHEPDLLDKGITVGNSLLERVNTRISEIEKLFMLYMDSDFKGSET